MDESERQWRREEARRRKQRVYRQRRIAAVAVLAALALLVGVVTASVTGGDGGGADGGDDDEQAEQKPAELPRGGRRIFPEHRVVGFYGAPQAAALGILGIGPPDGVAKKLDRQMRPYAELDRKKKTIPAFELIAVIAAGAPGEDGKYRTRQPDRIVKRYFDAARRAKALYVLDIQPGQADFMTETRRFEKYLVEPDVSLALDPEWAMDPGEVPGKTIGSTDATKINEVAAYLSKIVQERKLPQKLLIVHQFTDEMIERRELLKSYPGVALVLNVDGFGGQEIKIQKYRDFTQPPRKFAFGFKLFYEEDTDLLSPRQVLRLRPQPDVVMYE